MKTHQFTQPVSRPLYRAVARFSEGYGGFYRVLSRIEIADPCERNLLYCVLVGAARPNSTSAREPVNALFNPAVVTGLNRFATFAGLFSVAVGLLGLIGWAFGVAVLKSVIPGQVIIKPNAAVCFVLIGFSFWLLRKRNNQPFLSLKKLGGRLLAAIVTLVGLLSLTEHIFGWDWGSDQFGSVSPGLIAPITALDLLLLGLALILLDWTISLGSRRYWPSQFLALLAGIGSLVGLLDFVLGTHTPYTHIALQTAITLFLLSCGLICARTEWGLAGLFASSYLGGILTRRLLPAAVIVPLVIGTMAWKAYAAGLASEWGSGALMTVAMILLLGGLTLWTGYIIDRSDSERRKAEGSQRRREEELREAQRLARVGSWSWDPKTDNVTWSEGLYRIAGVDPKLPPPRFREQCRFYTPESFARLDAAVEKAIQTGSPYALELEMVRADGAVRSVKARGEVERDASGQIVLVRGTVHDITDLKRAENEARLLARLQAGVAELGQRALRGDRPDVILDETVTLIAGALDVEFCKVLELLPDRKAFLLRSGVGWKQGLVGHATVGSNEDSQAGFTLISGGPVIVHDLRVEERFSGPPLLREHGVVSGISVIIPTSEGPYGVLGAHTRQRRTFSSDEVHFLQSVAGVLGLMIERTRAEEDLQRSSDEIRDLYNNAPCGYHSLDKEGTFVRINDTELQWLGLTREQVIGKMKFPDLLTPESLNRFRESFPIFTTEGVIRDLEFDVVRKDGSILPVLLSATAITDSEGKYLMSRSMLYDMTERKRAEEALLESEATLKRAQELAHIGSWYLDIADNRLSWSDEVYRIFGIPTGTPLTYEAFLSTIHPDDRENAGKAWAAALHGAPYDIEHRIVTDGTSKWVREMAKVEFDNAGNAVNGIGTVQDITERKRAEDEIRLLARLQAVVAELGERALQSETPPVVLDEAVTQVARALAADYCKVLELMPSREALLLKHGAGWKPGYVGRATVGLGTESQAGYTLLSDQPVVVEDLRTEHRFGGTALLREHEVVSGVSVVISTKQGPYGVLAAHTRSHRTFTSDEVNFLQSVANVLGSAIERNRAEAQLLRINRANRALSLCNEALIRATDEATLLQQICQIVVEEAGYRLCWVGIAENDEAKSVRPVSQAGVEDGYLSTVNITWADTERGQGPTGTCIRTRQTVHVKDIATDPRMIPWRAEALKRGYASCVAIPLINDSSAFGALNIYAREPQAFGVEEVKLLTELASDLAFGLASLRIRRERARAEEEIRTLNAELEQRVIARTAELQTANKRKDELRMREQAASAELAQARERELEIGYRIQQTLLVEQPPTDVAGLRVAALSTPSHRIDGDFYAFFKLPDHRLDVIVGDVMGKGVPAALLGAATKSHFVETLSRLMALSRNDRLPPPNEIVTLAHTELARHLIDLENFVTLCYVRLDLNKRILDLVDCGHTGIIHLHGKTGLCEMVHGDNLPLGIREGEIFDQISVPFEAGDVLLFYSDGVTEARSVAGELFGEDRLLDCLTSNSKVEPAALVEAVRKAALAFSEPGRLTDDLTCVAIKVHQTPLPLARAEREIRSDFEELSRAREFVRAFCSRLPDAPLDQDSVAKLELAVTEATTNIIKHAYHRRTDQRIQIEAEAFATQVLFRLHHVGDPFDPALILLPPLDSSQESGFGLHLMAGSVDEIRYYRDERGGNCIALVENRPGTRSRSS